MPKRKERMAGYIRESDERLADSTTIDSAAKAVRTYGQKEGNIYEPQHEYKEAISAYMVPYMERKKLLEMLEAAKRHEFDVLVVTEVRAISRRQVEIFIVYDILQKYGVRLETIEEKFEDDAMGRIILGRRAGYAEIEREQSYVRMQRGKLDRIEIGRAPTNGSRYYGLLEGYLPRVIGMAKHQARLFRHFSLLDLIQEGNLGLLQAVEDYDFTEMTGCFFAYATACIRNAIIRALPRDGLIQVPRCEFWHLAAQGQLKDLDRAQPFSLDAPMAHQEWSLHEVLPASSLFAPAFSPAKRMQVDVLLARLTSHEQTIIRLLYGLEVEDGRTLTPKELAARFGVVPGTIRRTARRALRKLRLPAQLVVSASHAPRQQGRTQAEKHAQQLARRAEQEAKVAAAYARLEAQGAPITMLALAREAQVGTTIANRYLCARWGTVPERLEQAYAKLVPEAEAITVERLARAARVSERAASDFLHVQRRTVRQARPRRKAALTPVGTVSA